MNAEITEDYEADLAERVERARLGITDIDNLGLDDDGFDPDQDEPRDVCDECGRRPCHHECDAVHRRDTVRP